MIWTLLVAVAAWGACIALVRWQIRRDAEARKREELDAATKRWAERVRVRREAHHAARERLAALHRLHGGRHPAA